MINVYITNLGKYNEGYLIGKWLKLPATDEEVEKVLKEIGLAGGIAFMATSPQDIQKQLEEEFNHGKEKQCKSGRKTASKQSGKNPKKSKPKN